MPDKYSIQELNTLKNKTALHSDRIFQSKINDSWLLGIITALVATVFYADFQTQLGLVVWVFYLIPLILSYIMWNPFYPIVVAFLSTVFMIINFYLDAKGINREIAELNRAMGLFGIWTVAIIGSIFIRNKILVKKEEWIRTIQAEMSKTISGEQNYETLTQSILDYLSRYLKINAAVFYIKDENVFKRFGLYGVTKNGAPDYIDTNEGLPAQSIKNNELITLADVPDDYITYGSAFGKSKPTFLLLMPLRSNNETNGFIEFGSREKLSDTVYELLARTSELLSVAVRSAEYRKNLQEYLEETQRQSEELQAQSEELRVSNEELEEQSRALEESQSQLEQQQAELEQTNTQLEEQSQELEAQRDDLAKAKAELQLRARELEQASQYKSDFLANMSHELRTPLNSTLILAKLLADNGDGNLSDEQVKYAQTIRSSGNDLLTLINDILDLSKIEAGHMEIDAQPAGLKKIVQNMSSNFEPLAEKKNIKFKTEIVDGCPEKIVTDELRLEQVLKNLISNAVKFTAKGEVSLSVKRAPNDMIAFEIRDTGIGIAQDKQELIFQAFQQADGTTNRKFGGTGLGLSISSELSRLLGGEISVESEEGKGATFTLTIPVEYSPEAVKPRVEEALAEEEDAVSEPDNAPRVAPTQPAETPGAAAKSAANAAAPPLQAHDDRYSLSGLKKVILIIEDDDSFANILLDLSHDMGFECLVGSTAEEGIALCTEYLPHAILLDVNLPDHSGLSVLDQVKYNQKTRHIPVHVISSDDYSQTALTLGAIGFLSKPVKHDELKDALSNLENRLNTNVSRLLIVEDNKVQRESMKKLLGSPGVETVGVGTAKACLNKLKKETFDCMVLDLSLPDESGYELLEKLSEEDAYSFPPVIVYTGKDLSAAEEQKLRRYSKSIIIKGAKSPERLLDEVTLFLHKVVTDLSDNQQKMLKEARNRDAVMEGKRILVVEDDIRNVYSLTSILEPKGAIVEIARNGFEALDALDKSKNKGGEKIDLVLMDIMMPEMDGLTAMRKIRQDKAFKKLPIIALTAKAMKNDQENCLEAGADDYMSKPLDVEKLLSLIRVWIPR